MANKPKVNSEGEKELQKAADQFEAFDANVKEMTLDRMNMAPKQELEPQTKLSTREAQKSTDIYLKPHKTVSSRDKFNEKYREAYEFAREYVQFIAENKEVMGETIDMWTRPFAGMPAEEWLVPVNKPVWGPRYLAEQIRSKTYHRLVMQDRVTEDMGNMKMYGQMTVDTTIPRLTAEPVSGRKSVFMGANAL